MKRYIAIAYIAIICGYAHTSHSMIDINFPPKIHKAVSETPEIHKAVEKNNHRKVKKLISDAYDVNTPDTLGNTPLHIAAMKGRTKLIDILMEYGADIENTNIFNATPLMLAIQHHNNDIARQLITFYNANCDTPSVNRPHWIPIHARTLRTLLNSSNNIDARDNFNFTPLHLFCRSGNTKAAILHIQFGGDIYAKKGPQTPRSIAYEFGRNDIARILNALHTIRTTSSISNVITPHTDQHTRIRFANMLLGQQLYTAARTITHDIHTSNYARGKILLHNHTLQARTESYNNELQTCIDTIVNRSDATLIIRDMLAKAYAYVKDGVLPPKILHNIITYHRNAVAAYRNPITGDTFLHALAQSPYHRDHIFGIMPAIIDGNQYTPQPLHNYDQHTPASIASAHNKRQFMSQYYTELQAYNMHTQYKNGTLTDIMIHNNN